jgi:hypothetical protein
MCCRPLITSKSCASEIPFHGSKSLEIASGRDLGCMADVANGVSPTYFYQTEHRIQFRCCPMRFLGFSNHENEASRQEMLKRSTVCGTFSRSGWSVVRSASLSKGGNSKKRPSQHIHKVPTRNNKASRRILQTTLVFIDQKSSFSFGATPDVILQCIKHTEVVHSWNICYDTNS